MAPLERLFDPFFFLSHTGLPDEAFRNPLSFYENHWRDFPQFDPHPLFCQQYYLGQIRGKLKVSPRLHYLTRNKNAANPNPFFDEAFYREFQMPSKPTRGVRYSALEHYQKFVHTEDAPIPCRTFSHEYFLRHNRDLAEAGENPLKSLIRDPLSGLRLYSKTLSTCLASCFGKEQGNKRLPAITLRYIVIATGEGDQCRAQLQKSLEQIEKNMVKGNVEVIIFASTDTLSIAEEKLPSCAFPIHILFKENAAENLEHNSELALALHGLISPLKKNIILSNRHLRLPVNAPASFRFLDDQYCVKQDDAPERQQESIGKFIIPITDWEISGVNTWIRNLSAGLTFEGFDVELLCCGDFYRYTGSAALPLVPVHHLPVPSKKPALRRAAVIDYINSQTDAAVLTAYDFDTNDVIAQSDPHIPVVGILHSDDPDYYEHCKKVGESWQHIITVSDYISSQVSLINPEWKKKTTTIHYGVDSWDGSRPDRDDPSEPIRLIYTGRIVHQQKRLKDLPLLLDELEKLQISYRLDLVGDGPDLDALREVLANRIANGQVVIRGRLDPQQIHELLAVSHIFLLISDFEGLPLSLLEAMSHGVVPVVSDIASGIPEVVHHGETGFRVPIGNYAAFAETIARLAKESELWQSVSLRTQAFFRAELTTEVMTRRTIQLIDKIQPVSPGDKSSLSIHPPLRLVIPLCAMDGTVLFDQLDSHSYKSSVLSHQLNQQVVSVVSPSILSQLQKGTCAGRFLAVFRDKLARFVGNLPNTQDPVTIVDSLLLVTATLWTTSTNVSEIVLLDTGRSDSSDTLINNFCAALPRHVKVSILRCDQRVPVRIADVFSSEQAVEVATLEPSSIDFIDRDDWATLIKPLISEALKSSSENTSEVSSHPRITGLRHALRSIFLRKV